MKDCAACPALEGYATALSPVAKEVILALRVREDSGYILSKRIERSQSGVNRTLHRLKVDGVCVITRSEPTKKNAPQGRDIWDLTEFGKILGERLAQGASA